MRFAYADPPYPGCAFLYKKVDENAREVNHPLLIRHLCDEFPDGWALSTSSVALPYVLGVCGDVMGEASATVRIGSWVKPFAVYKPNVGVCYAWEPVLFKGGGGGPGSSRP